MDRYINRRRRIGYYPVCGRPGCGYGSGYSYWPGYGYGPGYGYYPGYGYTPVYGYPGYGYFYRDENSQENSQNTNY